MCNIGSDPDIKLMLEGHITTLGILLIVLSAPLLIGYFIGQKKNVMWRNLGAIMLVIGLLIALLGSR